MCGIAGIYRFDSSPEWAERGRRAVAAMTAALRHRGPDQNGFFHGDHLDLGHARLSIIDVAEGQQPIYNEDRSCVLVYNGEIYDYQALRAELHKRHYFRTQTDSEVLMHLFEEQGPRFADALNGMYAYALWDSRSALLHLGTDTLGIKPLYYYTNSHVFAFASELRALTVGLAVLGLQPELDTASVSEYLQLGWFQAPRTPLVGVAKAVPGCRLVVSPRGVRSSRAPLPAGESVPQPPADVAALDERLVQVVRSQLVADVPVGVFLSGGIDSSLLTAIASRQQPGIATFSIGFQGAGRESSAVDESRVAAKIAALLGTQHHELTIDGNRLRELIDPGLLAMDEPIADPAVLPLFCLAQFAREHVKVCLAGDGGDEVFGGYWHHRWRYARQWYHRLPGSLREAARRAGQWLPERPSQGYRERLRKLRVGLQLLSLEDYVAGPFAGPHRQWLVPDFASSHMDSRILSDDDAYFTDVLTRPLAGQMLPKTDRVTMHASLETRVPLLDQRIIAFGRGLPWARKVHRGTTKWILRELLGHYLPREITERPKHGFRVPLSTWFRGELRDFVRERLEAGRLPEEIISQKQVQRLVSEHAEGRAEHSIRIWALLALSTWMNRLPRATARVESAIVTPAAADAALTIGARWRRAS